MLSFYASVVLESSVHLHFIISAPTTVWMLQRHSLSSRLCLINSHQGAAACLHHDAAEPLSKFESNRIAGCLINSPQRFPEMMSTYSLLFTCPVWAWVSNLPVTSPNTTTLLPTIKKDELNLKSIWARLCWSTQCPRWRRTVILGLSCSEEVLSISGRGCWHVTKNSSIRTPHTQKQKAILTPSPSIQRIRSGSLLLNCLFFPYQHTSRAPARGTHPVSCRYPWPSPISSWRQSQGKALPVSWRPKLFPLFSVLCWTAVGLFSMWGLTMMAPLANGLGPFHFFCFLPCRGGAQRQLTTPERDGSG